MYDSALSFLWSHIVTCFSLQGSILCCIAIMPKPIFPAVMVSLFGPQPCNCTRDNSNQTKPTKCQWTHPYIFSTSLNNTSLHECFYINISMQCLAKMFYLMILFTCGLKHHKCIEMRPKHFQALCEFKVSSIRCSLKKSKIAIFKMLSS